MEIKNYDKWRNLCAKIFMIIPQRERRVHRQCAHCRCDRPCRSVDEFHETGNDSWADRRKYWPDGGCRSPRRTPHCVRYSPVHRWFCAYPDEAVVNSDRKAVEWARDWPVIVCDLCYRATIPGWWDPRRQDLWMRLISFYEEYRGRWSESVFF